MAKEEPGAIREVGPPGTRYEFSFRLTTAFPPEHGGGKGETITIATQVKSDSLWVAELWLEKMELMQLALDTPDAEAVLKAMHRMKGEGE
jgi:hypothetical protein